jgi:hypothetical protein
MGYSVFVLLKNLVMDICPEENADGIKCYPGFGLLLNIRYRASNDYGSYMMFLEIELKVWWMV